MAIQLKRSLTANLNTSYVLSSGQLGIEMPKSTNSSSYPFKMKIGDGTTKWSSLPYFGSTPSSRFQFAFGVQLNSNGIPTMPTAPDQSGYYINHTWLLSYYQYLAVWAKIFKITPDGTVTSLPISYSGSLVRYDYILLAQAGDLTSKNGVTGAPMLSNYAGFSINDVFGTTTVTNIKPALLQLTLSGSVPGSLTDDGQAICFSSTGIIKCV